MAAFPTQFASVASLSAPASLLSSTGPKPSPGSPSGLDLAARSAAMPPSHLPPVSQGPYTSSAAAAAAAQYSPAAAGLLAYSRLAPGFTDTMYGASFPNPAGGLYGLGADPSALYVNPITGTPYDLKENAEIWRNLSQQATCFAYDPTGLYSYGYGGMDLSLAARRKNATKENTGTLKAWLQEHKKNPYPTKGEKIMLAIITKMTLTQVSTWFANARRRLKKENKMTWSPRSGGRDDEDDDDDDVTNDDVTTHDKTQQRDLGSTGEEEEKEEEEEEDIIIDEGFEEQTCLASSRLQASLAAEALRRTSLPPSATAAPDLPPSASPRGDSPSPKASPEPRSPSPRHSPSPPPSDISGGGPDAGPPTVVIASKCSTSDSSPRGPKPRIWSLADVATSASPPAPRRSPGPPRAPLRSPWAVTATYALTHPNQGMPPHPYLMVPRTPLHHPIPFNMAPKMASTGQLEESQGTPRPRLQPSPLRSPSREAPHKDSPHRETPHRETPLTPHKSPMDNSAPRRPASVETAFKPVHKRIMTS